VKWSSGVPPDGEIITFLDSGVSIGKVALSGGMATFSISGLVSGTHSITASYPGDSTFAASTSTILSQVVAKPTTTTVVSSSSNPSNLGTAVSLTATVTSSTGVIPSGTVTFKDGAVTLATAGLSTSGTATYSSSALAGGAHSITAVFAATPTFQASTSAPLVQNVYIPGGINFSHASHVEYAYYSGSTATANVTINPGDTVIVVVAAGGYTFPTITSVVDSGGNTGYVQLANGAFGDTAQLFVWGALNVSNSASTLTVTFNHAMPSIAVDVATYTGVVGFGQVAMSTGPWSQPGVALTTQNPDNVVVMGVSQNVSGLSTYSPNIGGLRDSGSFVSSSLVGSLGFAVNDNSATTASTVANKVTCSNAGDWVAAAVELISPTL
jgi:large repetitive protein